MLLPRALFTEGMSRCQEKLPGDKLPRAEEFATSCFHIAWHQWKAKEFASCEAWTDYALDICETPDETFLINSGVQKYLVNARN